ncbi:hypothetical protein LCGC14_3058190 [marine sediment metagenome]|uniref:Uncharacterized protein n=1 Tax=marine sediment metagenome TaxID=412755 RepID=A0A0F8ZAG5_9ZZZZ
MTTVSTSLAIALIAAAAVPTSAPAAEAPAKGPGRTVAFLGVLLTVINPVMKLLVIDDLEQLDDLPGGGFRVRLMQGIAQLADRWDAVIVAGACDLGGVEGWNVVDLAAVPSLAETLTEAGRKAVT